MAVSTTRVSLNEAQMSAINLPGGMVSRRVDRVAGEIATLARVYSPKRTGQMAGSIGTERGYARRTGCMFRVTVGVSYATFVLGGTVGPIRAGLRRDSFGRFQPAATDSRGRRIGQRKHLPVGKSQGGPITFREMVAGQDANDFLTDATREVLARYKI